MINLSWILIFFLSWSNEMIKLIKALIITTPLELNFLSSVLCLPNKKIYKTWLASLARRQPKERGDACATSNLISLFLDRKKKSISLVFVTNWRRKWHDGFFICPTSVLFMKLWWRRKKEAVSVVCIMLTFISFLPYSAIHKRDAVSWDFGFFFCSLHYEILPKTTIGTQFVIKRSSGLWSHVDTLLERENAFRRRLSGSMNLASRNKTIFNHFFLQTTFFVRFSSRLIPRYSPIIANWRSFLSPNYARSIKMIYENRLARWI